VSFPGLVQELADLLLLRPAHRASPSPMADCLCFPVPPTS
jgi:hypothetical protein